MDNQQKKVSIITPFYNEGEGVDFFYESLTEVLNNIPDLDFEVVCITLFSPNNN
jgi:glycosyltransferase involved in cell wall biosynthesis